MPGPEAKSLFARRLDGMEGSAIRDLLKHAGVKDMISLGGGYPSPEGFPLPTIKLLREKVESREDYNTKILQYGPTEGLPEFLGILPNFLKRENRQVIATPETIAITAGSQQALAILGMMLIEPGDEVAVESPTYLGALQAFSPFKPKYVEIETDQDGIIPASLEKAFIDHPNIKFLYTVPTFQNPTGRTIPLEKRQQIASILKKYGKLAVEDDPYSELRYEGKPIPSIQSMAPDNVIHLFTFSKTFAPDIRIGGMVGPKEFIDKANLLKQGQSLYTSNYNQALIYEYIKGGFLDEHIPEIVKIYKPKRDAMAQTITENFPKIFEFTISQGGMFIWVKLKKEFESLTGKINIKEVLDEAIINKVAFVPGTPFFANATGNEVAMRLNFTNQSEENIVKAIRIIGEILQKKLVELV